MNPFEAAKEHILRFCESGEQRIYALKGPWGVGKSFLVRKLFKEGNARLPKHISYVSVFGLGTVHEVQERMVGCLEQHRSVLGNRMTRWLNAAAKFTASKLSKAKPPIPYLPVELPDFSTAAFWHVAKKSDLLIVLDDLERANPSLQLAQILGLASSITENSRAKVLLVFNDEELQGDGPETLARLREKVIDGEFTFRPRLADLVGEYLGEPALQETVVACLNIAGGPNIRQIRRIKRGIRFFRETLAALGLPVDEAVLPQVAKVIWHFQNSPTPLTSDVSLALAIWGEGGVTGEEESSEADQEANRLAREAGMRTTPFDKLMLEYLNHGHASEEFLQEFAREQKVRHRSIELEGVVDAVLHLYSMNFQASAETVASRFEEVLDRHCEELSLSQMFDLTVILNGVGRPTTPWWRRHVRAVGPTLTADGCISYLSPQVMLTDPEARQIIQSRLDALTAPFDPKAAVIRIGTESSMNRHDIPRLNALDAGYYKEWFQTAEGDLLTPLRAFLEYLGGFPAEMPEGQLRQKIVGVLTELSGEDPANYLRVKHRLDVPVSPTT